MAKNEAEIILKGKFENGQAIVDATKKIDKNIKDIGESSNQAEKQSSKLSSTLKKLGAIVGVTYLANSFKNLVKGSLNAAGAMEQVDIALTTMLGSAKEAAKLQKDLVEFAKKTPFEIEGIFSSTKQLLAYGIAQEDIIDTMSVLGNIASGVGVDMNRLALAFGQVKTTGRLMGQDLNQFTQAGVPLLAALAENLGKSEAEILQLKEAGQISFEQVKAALEGMTQEGGRFFNLMENQSKTFLGTVSNMSDSFYQVKVALGEALLPVAKRVVDSMIIFLGNLQKSIQENQATITKLANAFVGAFSLMGKAIGVVISIVKHFVAGIAQILKIPLVKEILAAAAAVLVFSKGMAALTLAVRIFTTTALGWVSVIISIISAIGYLSQGIEKMPNFLKVAVLTMGKWWEQLKYSVFSVIDSIIERLQVLENIPGFGWIKDVKNDFSETKDSIIKNIDEINNALNELDSPSVQAPTPEEVTQKVTTKQIEAGTAPEAANSGTKLEALQEEHKALLAEQQKYLGQAKSNDDNALELALENERLKKEGKLLSQGEYADRKRELDQMLLDDEIALEDYKRAVEQLNNEAKLETLQEQYDAEREKFVENQEMMNEIKNEMQLTQDETELEMLQRKLDSIVQKQEIQNQRLLKAKINKDDADRKQDKKTGDLELKFKKFMDNERIKGATQTANQLVKLQNSKNKQLAAIGKAAAIYQITIDTAQSAVAAFSGFNQAFPQPAGMIAGAAAAAAVIAYGAERIGNVRSASYAVGTPDIPQDHMAMVHAGEMIIPATFADAIRSGDLSLSAGGAASGESFNTPSQQITISFEGASFYGRMQDEDIVEIGERLGEMITENIITPIPTRRA
jgi:tape measure domain-containing protein